MNRKNLYIVSYISAVTGNRRDTTVEGLPAARTVARNLEKEGAKCVTFYKYTPAPIR